MRLHPTRLPVGGAAPRLNTNRGNPQADFGFWRIRRSIRTSLGWRRVAVERPLDTHQGDDMRRALLVAAIIGLAPFRVEAQVNTCEDVDGSPSFTNLTKLQFDQLDGFWLTSPAAGTARVDLLRTDIDCTGTLCQSVSAAAHEVTTPTDASGTLGSTWMWNVVENGTSCNSAACRWLAVKGSNAGDGGADMEFRRGDPNTTNGVRSIRIRGSVAGAAPAQSTFRGQVVAEVLGAGD